MLLRLVSDEMLLRLLQAEVVWWFVIVGMMNSGRENWSGSNVFVDVSSFDSFATFISCLLFWLFRIISYLQASFFRLFRDEVLLGIA